MTTGWQQQVADAVRVWEALSPSEPPDVVVVRVGGVLVFLVFIPRFIHIKKRKKCGLLHRFPPSKNPSET